MKIRKYFLLVMALIFINFLNLNASQKRLGEKEATNSLVSSTKLNLVQKNNKKIFKYMFYMLMLVISIFYYPESKLLKGEVFYNDCK